MCTHRNHLEFSISSAVRKIRLLPSMAVKFLRHSWYFNQTIDEKYVKIMQVVYKTLSRPSTNFHLYCAHFRNIFYVYWRVFLKIKKETVFDVSFEIIPFVWDFKIKFWFLDFESTYIQYFTQFGHMAELSESEFVLQ
jgi:hypothetical protein